MASQAASIFPPELWYRVVDHLPIFEQKTLLQVSRTLHDIAIAFVFSSLKIYLVDSNSAYAVCGSYDQENINKLMRRSWELLYHITRHQSFAKRVKCLTVIATMDGGAIFEQLTLAEALLSLSNLQTFRWFGVLPAITEDIMNCIPKSVKSLVLNSSDCSPTIIHLALPLDSFPVNEESYLRGMDKELLEYSEQMDVREIFEQLSTPLKEVNMLACHINQTPIWLYESLTSLEVYSTLDGPELSGLELVFRHAGSLQSLTISGVGMPDLSFLPKNPLHLPHLHSFRLTRECEPATFGELYSLPLCAFLQGRQQLRRLYIRIESATSDDLSTLLRAVCGLRQLEVFGLHTGFSPFGDTEISVLAENLPVNLKALQLLLIWDVTPTSISSLVSALEVFPRLSFLHLSSVEDLVMPLMVESLASDMKQLDLLGLNHALWNIERSAEEVTLHRWARWKTRFCVEEDFDNEDDAWLYRYHRGRPS
ncbi:hypothetical protein BDQ17DRAFT_1232571 [Cyathus striatus]|nr:hypothetical protein BDQ17DRAFT_1232571 [Cyathus striatus]